VNPTKHQDDLRPGASTTSRINIALSAAVFTLSSLTYFALPNEGFEGNAEILILPLLFFGIVVVLMLLSPKRWPSRGSLWGGEGSAVVWLLPIFTLLPSLFSSYGRSFQYWILDSAVLILCRLYGARVPLRDVVEGLFWSGVLVIASVLFFAGELLLDAINTLSRFVAFGFHPNTLAFILGTFYPVALWQLIAGRLFKKILAGFCALACLLIIFLASSRGSLVAVLASSVIAGALYCIHKKRFKLLFVTPVLLCFLIGISLNGSALDTVWQWMDQILQLSSGDRGIGSGFSGRLEEWRATWVLLLRGIWIYGNGARSSDAFPFPVDNGYLVLLYDLGIVPFCLVVGRFIRILARAFRNYVQTGASIDLILFFLLLSFLLNNLTARFLFGVGNTSSLFAILLLASPWATLSAARLMPSRPLPGNAPNAGTVPA